jgi:hypothetical protein
MNPKLAFAILGVELVIL